MAGVALGELAHHRDRLPLTGTEQSPQPLQFSRVQGSGFPAPVVYVSLQLMDGEGQAKAFEVHARPGHGHNPCGHSPAFHNCVGGKGCGKLEPDRPVPRVVPPDLFQGLPRAGKEVPVISGDLGQGSYLGLFEQGRIGVRAPHIDTDRVQDRPSFTWQVGNSTP